MNIRNFTVLGSLVFSGVLALGACGSSSSSGTGGTSGLGGSVGSVGGTIGSAGGHVGSAGGHVGSVGGSTGTAAGGATGSCTNIPHCLTPFLGCLSSGTCTYQSSGSVLTGDSTDSVCYSNGIKSVSVGSIDLTSGTLSITDTVYKNGAPCYSEVLAESGAGGASGAAANAIITIKNAAGAVVGTLTESADGSTSTILCTGDTTPLPLPSDCGMTAGSTSDCTMGVCQ